MCVFFARKSLDSISRFTLARSSLHAALGTRYGIGDDDLLHQVAIGLEADGLPGFRGERVQLSNGRNIRRLNIIINDKRDCA